MPSTLYSGGEYGLYRTDDCGVAWSKLPNLGTPISDRQSLSYEVTTVSPSGRLFVYRADSVLSWTDDDGQTWTSPGGLSTFPYPLQFVRSGIGWAVFYHPARGSGGNQTIASSTDDGLTWTHGARGLMPRVFCVDARDGNAILGQKRAGEIVRSTDLYATSTSWATFPQQVRAIVGNDDGSIFWVATDDGILHRSRDGGQTWDDAGQTPGVIRENGLMVSHHDPTALFAINDSGELWYLLDDPNVAVAAPVQVP